MYNAGNSIFSSQSPWIRVHTVKWHTFVSQLDQSITSLQILLAGEVQSLAIRGIGISPAEVC